jgi:hypothetical protein
MKNPLDYFFSLGNKATKGNPVRKAQYDFYLYSIIFLAFLALAINYYYNFFFKGQSFSQLMWAIVLTIFGYFNYWALTAFYNVYKNIKEVSEKYNPQKEEKIESVNEMLEGLNGRTAKTKTKIGRTAETEAS